MVVCQLVRIRNLSRRTFRLVSDDPFYSSPSIGEDNAEDAFEIPPDFDEAAKGLVVPWSQTTINGLIIQEAESGQGLRCSVGPKENDDSGCDWLQFHDTSWTPVRQETVGCSWASGTGSAPLGNQCSCN
ncbi:unnamed protein product [Effrenium voratum]|nr:unnamed protein product [Effrenium voratum]